MEVGNFQASNEHLLWISIGSSSSSGIAWFTVCLDTSGMQAVGDGVLVSVVTSFPVSIHFFPNCWFNEQKLVNLIIKKRRISLPLTLIA